ncbi:MAG: winged helix-turn-helix domain-containing protein [Hyphomicrobiales bacterium]|nr:winged helix-turn-helix domain-containing protein [Hyphomicrobiales bacterium]
MISRVEARLRDENEVLREHNLQLQELIRPDNVLIVDDWRLTQFERRLFRCLTTRTWCPYDILMAALYADQPGDHPDARILRVMVSKMRTKLRPFGVEIETVWGLGYRLRDRKRFVRPPSLPKQINGSRGRRS